MLILRLGLVGRGDLPSGVVVDSPISRNVYFCLRLTES